MINHNYSTTLLLTKPHDDSLQYGNDGKVTSNTKFAINNAIFNIKNSKIIGKQQDAFETMLFLPEGEGRQGEGGLRTRGYFKHSYKMVNGEWWIVDSDNNPVIPAPEEIQSKIKQYLSSNAQYQTPITYLPLITVITVVYNGAKYLEETILSVINQTYPNVEYIIIDGGSTDDTPDIIKKYEDYIDYWVSEKDKGIYDAMNKGIDLANGEWINFMNAGDKFSNYSTIINTYLNINMNFDVIYSDVEIDFGKFTVVKKPLTLERMDLGMTFHHQSCFVKTHLMKQYKFDTTYKLVADYNFLYTLYQSGNVFYYFNKPISKVIPDGYADKQRLKVLKEYYRIQSSKNKFFSSIYFVYRYLSELVKLIIKKILPKKLIENIRLYKYRGEIRNF